MQSQPFIRYYKVIRRGSDPIHLPEDTLQSLLDSTNQLVKWENGGDWRLINKADIVDAHYDREYSEEKNKEVQNKKYDRYLDKQKNVVVMVEMGTIPDDLARYEKI